MPKVIENPRRESIPLDDEALSPGTERTLAIFEVLGRHREGRNISEIARDLELPVNSVFRITNTLWKRGYVDRRDSDKRFVLTSRLFELAQPLIREKSLVECSLGALRRLRDETGETAQLLVPSDFKSVVLEQCVSTQAIKVTGSIGFRVPLYSCAPGKAILARLPGDELETFFETVTLKSFTEHTLATRESLEVDLARIRKRGYALDLAEGNDGIHCVGAAILDDKGYPIGGVTVIGPSFRLKRDQFAKLGAACVRAAVEIQEMLLS